jgi:hypothetical protein
MCKEASFVLTKDRAFFSKTSDSHDQIIIEHDLHADGVGGPNVARVEIVPPGGDYRLPLDQWVYSLDQDIVPEWYDAEECEARVRQVLPEWVAAKTVPPGQVVGVEAGQVIVANYGTVTDNYGTVTYNYGTVTYNRGTVTNNWSGGTVTDNCGTVTNNWSGGTVTDNRGTVTYNRYGGTVTNNWGTVTYNRGTVTNNWYGGTVQTYVELPRSINMSSDAVIIDRSRGTVVAHVGAGDEPANARP